MNREKSGAEVCPYCGENENEANSQEWCRRCYMEIYGIPDDDSESDSGYESNQ